MRWRTNKQRTNNTRGTRMETNKPDEPDNRTTTEKLEEQIREANEKLDQKTKLNWLEKITVRKLIRKAKKELQKELQKTKENKITEKELNERLTKAIVEMKEHFEIEIDQYNEHGTIDTDKKGKPIQVDANQITLLYMPLNKKVETFEQILKEMEKII